ncbi:MAG TPA: ion transporter [Thiotrichaceae bacterium]|nr:ion transporter [Thiotrichaceae bacterium]
MKLQWIQDKFSLLHNHKLFQWVVIGVIVTSALVIGVQTYELPQGLVVIIKGLDWFITIFFLLEIIIRMTGSSSIKVFLKDPWNIFDTLIVITSLIPLSGSETALLGRLLRIFRVLRLVSVIPELRVLLNALIAAIPRMGYVSLLMFIIFYIYAAIGAIFFSGIDTTLWGNISTSMLTLFRIATFDSWTSIMYATMEVHTLSWIYYFSFIFIVAFVFLNMMIGIVLDTLQEEHQKEDRETGQGESGEVHWIKEHTAAMESRLERIEYWLYYLKNSADIQAPSQTLAKDKVITEAFQVAEFLALSKDEQLAYQADSKSRLDYINVMTYVKEEAKKEGREEGQLEQKVATAKQLFKMGRLSLGEIKEITGLSVEALKKIQGAAF